MTMPSGAVRNTSKRVVNAALRTDLYAFVQAFFPMISSGDELLRNWHIEAITYALMRVMRGEITRLIITVPPRALKSICASVAFPAFMLGHDPKRRIICVSYSESLARKHANDCRALMRSERYRQLFPSTRISPSKDTELEAMTTARGFRLATSVGGTLTGRGGNLIVIDDPMKPQDAQSQSARDSTIQWYANTLLTRLDNKARDAIVVVMQRLHSDDLVGYLLEQDGWTHLNLPAIAEVEERIPLRPDRFHVREPGDLLHPEREPQTVLDQIKRTMGSIEFAAQFQQTPVPPGGNLIKWSWFRFYEEEPAYLPNDRIIVSWDTAMSSGELSDYSVCIVVLARGETVYVLDVLRDRLDYPALKRKTIEIHQQWRRAARNYALLIENKGSGMSLIQDLRQLNIHAARVDPEGDKIMRMNRQTARIEAGSVFLPTHAPWLDDFRSEMMAFPAGRYNDQVDALSQALDRAFNYRGMPAGIGRY
jgi:predicted phage terminase large subunit-like protein